MYMNNIRLQVKCIYFMETNRFVENQWKFGFDVRRDSIVLKQTYFEAYHSFGTYTNAGTRNL